MTQEQAIDLLDNLIGMIEDNQENDYDKALKMAIQALQAQAEKTCDTCKHSGKNPYTDEPCSECDECMLWEQAHAEPQVKCGACIHHHGALLECDIYGCEFEPKQADGDLVSRQAAINAIKEIAPVDTEYDCTLYDKGDIMYVLSELPTVAIPSAEPKTGHWKRISMDKYTTHAQHWYECDKCGKDNLGNTDWCPNCGARMVEPQEVREYDLQMDSSRG